MTFRLHVFAVATLVLATPLWPQGFERGDVIVVGVDYDEGEDFPISNVRVHGRDGAFRRELISVDRLLTEPLYRNGIVYITSRGPYEIERIDAVGNLLTPFATPVVNGNFLSPGPDGGILATNGSGELYQFSADGTLVHFHDSTYDPPALGGIDLAADQCTVFYATSGLLTRWDACLDTPASFFGPRLAGSSRALRLLSDGTFLIAVKGLLPDFENRVIHVDQGGNLIRSYPIPGDALALDIDGTSFWTNAGNNLFRLDIATGQILSTTFTNDTIMGLSVVGEPRAGLAAGTGVPTMSPLFLTALAVVLAVLGLIKLRIS
jgi:outer membrane protein assembly factor BamB